MYIIYGYNLWTQTTYLLSENIDGPRNYVILIKEDAHYISML